MNIEIDGLDELRDRLGNSQKFKQLMRSAMDASLLRLWQETGNSYYPEQREGVSYVRTGTLGRTLGVDMGGGTAGKPEVYEVKEMGSGYTGQFGTRLDYAGYVIGDNQTGVHASTWSTLSHVAEDALDGIMEIFERMAQAIADYIEGR